MDYHRNKQLEIDKGTQQYGETLDLSFPQGTPLASGVVATKDLIRITGTKWDVDAWRVYLAPWQARAQQPSTLIPAPPLGTVYAKPAMGDLPGTQIPSAATMDAFASMEIYAKITFGSGGWQQTAYVDWPARGQAISLSTSFLMVSGAVRSNSGLSLQQTLLRLPTLAASVGPETGGRVARPATYTYPKQPSGAAVAGTSYRWHFQVPNFAHSFTPLVDVSNLFRVGTFSEMRIAVQHTPGPIATAALNVMSWYYTNANPQLQSIDWPLSPYPIPGQLINLVQSGHTSGAIVTIEIDSTAGATDNQFMGCMFELDLG